MNGRKQKTEQDTYQRKNRAEPEVHEGGQTFLWMTEKGDININEQKQGLFEFILSPSNMNSAYLQVKRNNGSGGVDGMQIDEFLHYLQSHKEELIELLRCGRYKPQPVRRVDIFKDNGTKRHLGIPTVFDRVVQQAIAGQLSAIYERQFSTSSYEFRPKRSAHQAVQQCQRYSNEGYRYVVDMDLEINKSWVHLFLGILQYCS